MTKPESTSYRRDHPEGIAKTRGAIDYFKLRELLEHAEVKNTPFAKSYLILNAAPISALIRCFLRSLLSVSSGLRQQISLEDYQLHLHLSQAQSKSSHIKKAVYYHVCDATHVDHLTEQIRLAKASRHGFLHQDWDPVKARDLIKNCSKDLAWDDSLQMGQSQHSSWGCSQRC